MGMYFTDTDVEIDGTRGKIINSISKTLTSVELASAFEKATALAARSGKPRDITTSLLAEHAYDQKLLRQERTQRRAELGMLVV
jgi:hypothetical protein